MRALEFRLVVRPAEEMGPGPYRCCTSAIRYSPQPCGPAVRLRMDLRVPNRRGCSSQRRFASASWPALAAWHIPFQRVCQSADQVWPSNALSARTSERTDCGYIAAKRRAILPPIESPTTCAGAAPRWDRRAFRSSSCAYLAWDGSEE